METESSNQFALGAFLGAAVGDAAGGTLEFLMQRPTLDQVQQAMKMPGGGALWLAPGQITDDTELAICLAQGLVKSQSSERTQPGEIDWESVAERYSSWVASEPFDIGNTTQSSLGTHIDPNLGCELSMRQAAATHCMGSKANGSLMRIVPLGIWGHSVSTDELAELARKDSGLSHPNQTTCDAVACYTVAIAHLINHANDSAGAFSIAETWAKSNAGEEVNQWLDAAKKKIDVGYYPHIGFVKYGFVHAFRHLLLGTPYIDAIQETLLGWGDTDTNACIVGGLIGAAQGCQAIPQQMQQAVIDCDTSQGQPRPMFLSASQIPGLVQQLVEG